MQLKPGKAARKLFSLGCVFGLVPFSRRPRLHGCVLCIFAIWRICARFPAFKDYICGTQVLTLTKIQAAKQRSAAGEGLQQAAEAVARDAGGECRHQDMGSGLSMLLADLFPYSAKAIESKVEDLVPSLLEKHKPKWMEGIDIDRT